jgi:hypothetical protein
MYYYAPVPVNLYIKVVTNQPLTVERQLEIKQAVQNLSNSREIGANYTTAYIIDSLNANISFTEVVDIKISSDAGTTWNSTTDFNEGNIGLIGASHISFEWPIGE